MTRPPDVRNGPSSPTGTVSKNFDSPVIVPASQRIDGVALAEYVENFRYRVLSDALAEATSFYWRHRADALDAARPRRGDFTGRATVERLREQDQRLATAARACRQRAAVAPLGGEWA